jgi:hypothetical protein
MARSVTLFIQLRPTAKKHLQLNRLYGLHFSFRELTRWHMTEVAERTSF